MARLFSKPLFSGLASFQFRSIVTIRQLISKTMLDHLQVKILNLVSGPLERQATSEYVAGVPYSSLTVGAPREIYPNERRVSLTPQNCATLYKKGFSKVLVEYNAGAQAQF